MDRDMLVEHLAEAEAHVIEGIGHIADQRTVIAEMKHVGHDTTLADKLLLRLLRGQELLERHRDLLKRELDATS
jgi:hypothetical protein